MFGKTIENIDNRVDVRLICDQKKGIKLATKPNYMTTEIFSTRI